MNTAKSTYHILSSAPSFARSRTQQVYAGYVETLTRLIHSNGCCDRFISDLILPHNIDSAFLIKYLVSNKRIQNEHFYRAIRGHLQ